jgi:hypothetical protein
MSGYRFRGLYLHITFEKWQERHASWPKVDPAIIELVKEHCPNCYIPTPPAYSRDFLSILSPASPVYYYYVDLTNKVLNLHRKGTGATLDAIINRFHSKSLDAFTLDLPTQPLTLPYRRLFNQSTDLTSELANAKKIANPENDSYPLPHVDPRGVYENATGRGYAAYLRWLGLTCYRSVDTLEDAYNEAFILTPPLRDPLLERRPTRGLVLDGVSVPTTKLYVPEAFIATPNFHIDDL